MYFLRYTLVLLRKSLYSKLKNSYRIIKGIIACWNTFQLPHMCPIWGETLFLWVVVGGKEIRSPLSLAPGRQLWLKCVAEIHWVLPFRTLNISSELRVVEKSGSNLCTTTVKAEQRTVHCRSGGTGNVTWIQSRLQESLWWNGWSGKCSSLGLGTSRWTLPSKSELALKKPVHSSGVKYHTWFSQADNNYFCFPLMSLKALFTFLKTSSRVTPCFFWHHPLPRHSQLYIDLHFSNFCSLLHKMFVIPIFILNIYFLGDICFSWISLNSGW